MSEKLKMQEHAAHHRWGTLDDPEPPGLCGAFPTPDLVVSTLQTSLFWEGRFANLIYARVPSHYCPPPSPGAFARYLGGWGGGRGERTYGGRPGQRVEEQGTWAAQKHSEAGDGRPVGRGVWTANTVRRPRQQPAHPQYANYWAPLTRKRHIPPHSAQSQHANYWAPRTRKRHQQEHWPQRPTERSDPTQHAKGRTGDRPGPRKGATTRRNVTQGGGSQVRPAPPGPSALLLPSLVLHSQSKACPASGNRHWWSGWRTLSTGQRLAGP